MENSETSSWSDETPPSAPPIPADAPQDTIDIEFIDPDLKPIAGLDYLFEYDGKRISGRTGEDGSATQLTGISAGTLVDVYVFREHLVDYKKIGTLCGMGGECGFSITSPKLKYAIETEFHQGEVGNAESNQAPIPPAIETLHPVITNVPAPAVLPPAKPPEPGSSPAKKSEPPKIETGRDCKGHPHATIKPSTVDVLFHLLSPGYVVWQRLRAAYTDKTKEQCTPQQTQQRQSTLATAHPAVNPPLQVAANTGKELSKHEKEYLNALISYAEKQVLIDYKEYKKGQVSRKILEAVNAHPPAQSPAKKADKTLGMCWAYVRVALHQNRFVTASAGNGQAKNAGVDLLVEGFKSVTDTLPKVKISYDEAPSDSQKKELDKAYAKRDAIRAKAEKENWKESRLNAELKKNPLPEIEGEGNSYEQPDLMYTLPGDIVVYEQVVPYDPDAAGHVDIRTYHGFVSDFVWRVTPKLGGRKEDGKQYRVIGVYRKISDTMAMVRVKAFLNVIRSRETSGYSDAEAWYAMYSPTTKKLKATSIETHPFSESNDKPAGAYQIIFSTWRRVSKIIMGWPVTFYPHDQERVAIYLLHAVRNRNDRLRSALGYIMEGKIEQAITETALVGQWSSLPGGTETRGYTMSQLKTDYEKFLKELS